MGGAKPVYFCTSSENPPFFDKKGSSFSAIITFLSFHFLNGVIPKLREVFHFGKFTMLRRKY